MAFILNKGSRSTIFCKNLFLYLRLYISQMGLFLIIATLHLTFGICYLTIGTFVLIIAPLYFTVANPYLTLEIISHNWVLCLTSHNYFDRTILIVWTLYLTKKVYFKLCQLPFLFWGRNRPPYVFCKKTFHKQIFLMFKKYIVPNYWHFLSVEY